MLYEFINKLERSLQCVLCYLLNLCLQPIYIILQIAQGLVDIWGDEETIDPTEQTQVVTQLPSTNEGVCGENCDYPIGFHISQTEQAEIERIKGQLGKQ